MIVFRIDAEPEEVPVATVIRDMLPGDPESFTAFNAAHDAKKPVLFITRKGESVIAFPGTIDEAGPNATYRTLFDKAVLLDDMRAWSKEGHSGTTRPQRHYLIRLAVRAVVDGSCVVAVVAKDIVEAKELLERELDNVETRVALQNRALASGRVTDTDTAVQDYYIGRVAEPTDATFSIVMEKGEAATKDEDS